MADSKDVYVLIIGAGVTGLLIAHGLKKAGIKYAIFEAEQATTYRQREWSMGVHWALPQLESLLPENLIARLKEAQSDPSMEPLVDDIMPMIAPGENGPQVIARVPVPKLIRYSRRKLRTLCSEGIDVQYGCSLAGVEYGAEGTSVTATFDNGETATGTMIIGCDGPRSRVRYTLLGAAADITPIDSVHANIAIIYHDADKANFVRSAHPVFSVGVAPSNVLVFITIQDVPDPSDPANWRFQVVVAWSGTEDPSMTNTQRLAQLKSKTEQSPEPFRSAVAWLPDDTSVTYDKIGDWVSTNWENRDGRATLAGDAAHPMTPYRGQGLNNAICDAGNFITTLTKIISGEVSLKDGITAYSEEVVKRGAEEVIISKRSGEATMNFEQLMSSPMIVRGLSKNK